LPETHSRSLGPAGYLISPQSLQGAAGNGYYYGQPYSWAPNCFAPIRDHADKDQSWGAKRKRYWEYLSQYFFPTKTKESVSAGLAAVEPIETPPRLPAAHEHRKHPITWSTRAHRRAVRRLL